MKILVASPIDTEAFEKLRKRHEVVCALNATDGELKSLIKDYEILIFRSGVYVSDEVLKSAPSLRLLIRAGSGFDNVDLDYVQRHHIKFVTIPDPGAQAVAEMAFALMLALARNIVTAHRLLESGIWAKYQLEGHLITGKKLGIVGLGNIGRRVAQLGVAWGMHPVGCVAHPSPKRTEELRVLGVELMPFDDVIASADILTLHTPLTESTFYLIDAAVISRMKTGAFLINLARGGVVDEKALASALKNGKLGGAALDVHEQEGEGKVSPLVGLPNVILTPHIGAMALESQHEIGQRIIRIVESL